MNGPSHLFQFFHHTILLFRVIMKNDSEPIPHFHAVPGCSHSQNLPNLTSGIVKNKANVNGKVPWRGDPPPPNPASKPTVGFRKEGLPIFGHLN